MKNTIKRFLTWNPHRSDGFTLVELIVVIAILAILAAVAIPAYSGYITKAERAGDEQLLGAVNTAFAAACMDNNLDHYLDVQNGATITITAKKMDGADTATYIKNIKFADGVTQDATALATAINKAFALFYSGNENAEWKYYQSLVLKDGVFVGSELTVKQMLILAWEKSSYYGDEKIVQTMLGTFDWISDWFGPAAGSLEELSEMLLGNASDELDKVFGGTTGFTELEKAMNLSDEVIAEYVAAYEEKNGVKLEGEELDSFVATIKGNAGMMYFAQGTEGKTAEAMKNDLDVYMAVLTAPMTEYSGLTQEDFERDYLKYLSDDAKQAYEDALVNNGGSFAKAVQSTCSGLGGAQFSFAQMAAMEKKAQELSEQGVANSSGISTLGSLYAVAAGYFNSDIYKNGVKDGTIEAVDNPSYGDYGTVEAALKSGGFADYYNSEQSKADLDAYLRFMEYLAANDNMDLTNGNAFGGVNQDGTIVGGLGDYMNGALGSNE